MGKSTYAATANAKQAAKRYASDCSDADWERIAPFTQKPAGSYQLAFKGTILRKGAKTQTAAGGSPLRA